MKTLFTKTSPGFTTTSEKQDTGATIFRSSAVGVKPQRGFTLIETFVATSVLLVSLAAPLSIAAQSLRSAYYARDQVTAFYLAQEGVEYIQAKRNENYIASAGWLTGLDSCVTTACNIDMPNYTHVSCPVTCAPLLIDNTNNLFKVTTSNGTPSVFTRSVRITSITASEVRVAVTISWVSAGINRSFQISEHLFNWL